MDHNRPLLLRTFFVDAGPGSHERVSGGQQT